MVQNSQSMFYSHLDLNPVAVYSVVLNSRRCYYIGSVFFDPQLLLLGCFSSCPASWSLYLEWSCCLKITFNVSFVLFCWWLILKCLVMCITDCVSLESFFSLWLDVFPQFWNIFGLNIFRCDFCPFPWYFPAVLLSMPHSGYFLLGPVFRCSKSLEFCLIC